MVKVTILYFASARDRLGGKSEEVVSLPDTTWKDCDELVSFLCSNICPEVSPLRDSLALALNEEYCLPGQNITLHDNDTVALIPPITGG